MRGKNSRIHFLVCVMSFTFRHRENFNWMDARVDGRYWFSVNYDALIKSNSWFFMLITSRYIQSPNHCWSRRNLCASLILNSSAAVLLNVLQSFCKKSHFLITNSIAKVWPMSFPVDFRIQIACSQLLKYLKQKYVGLLKQ